MVVIARDRCCVAHKIDPKSGMCRDKWGYLMHPCEIKNLEADYVRHGATAPRHVSASDHVLICPGHHRGTGPSRGEVWATAHRQELRAYLDAQNERRT